MVEGCGFHGSNNYLRGQRGTDGKDLNGLVQMLAISFRVKQQ